MGCVFATSWISRAVPAATADTGVVRTMPVYAVDERGVAIPSLALAAVAVADDNAPLPVQRPNGVQVGDRFVPAPEGELAINWSPRLGSGAAEEISAIDVLSGDVAPDVFRNRIVVVGTTEPTLGDQHLVPTDRSGSTSGVSVIANALNTIVTDGYLTRPPRSGELTLIVVVGAIVGLAFALTRVTLAAGLTVALLACAVLIRVVALPRGGGALERGLAGTHGGGGGGGLVRLEVRHRDPPPAPGLVPLLHLRTGRRRRGPR
jgi:hypothetical protein